VCHSSSDSVTNVTSILQSEDEWHTIVRNIDVTLVTESEDEWHTIVRNIDVTLVTESEDEWHTIVRRHGCFLSFKAI
jgi:hypothetical protein